MKNLIIVGDCCGFKKFAHVEKVEFLKGANLYKMDAF